MDLVLQDPHALLSSYSEMIDNLFIDTVRQNSKASSLEVILEWLLRPWRSVRDQSLYANTKPAWMRFPHWSFEFHCCKELSTISLPLLIGIGFEATALKSIVFESRLCN